MQVGEEQDSDIIETDLGKQVLLFTGRASSARWKPKYCWNFLVAEHPSVDPAVQGGRWH